MMVYSVLKCNKKFSGAVDQGLSTMDNGPWTNFALLTTLFFLCLSTLSASAQSATPSYTNKDTTIILISDLHVQLECTQALNDLYNFNFRRAEFQFTYLKSKFPWHPLPYFLMGLIEWWKIMPNTNDTSHDETFLRTWIAPLWLARNYTTNIPPYKTEAPFFLSAAYAFKGRLYADEERRTGVKPFP